MTEKQVEVIITYETKNRRYRIEQQNDNAPSKIVYVEDDFDNREFMLDKIVELLEQ